MIDRTFLTFMCVVVVVVVVNVVYVLADCKTGVFNHASTIIAGSDNHHTTMLFSVQTGQKLTSLTHEPDSSSGRHHTTTKPCFSPFDDLVLSHGTFTTFCYIPCSARSFWLELCWNLKQAGWLTGESQWCRRVVGPALLASHPQVRSADQLRQRRFQSVGPRGGHQQVRGSAHAARVCAGSLTLARATLACATVRCGICTRSSC
jgi:hypothetical protein